MHFNLRNYCYLFALLVLFCLFAAYTPVGEKQLEPISESSSLEHLLDELKTDEIAEGKYFRLVDEKEELITITGRRIRPGDRYLDEKNRLYEVSRVKDYVATARYLRTEEIKKPERRDFFPTILVQTQKTEQKTPAKKVIAIYHTHNDECYVPTDGTDSKYGHGGIHQVGAALQKALEKKNIKAIHSEDMHLPHDEGAYRRSRDTALKLLQEDPDAIFDVHRDAAPMEAYATKVDEDWVTKIQFVVGRENPTSVVTKEFAYDMKGLADDVYPGLIKGIFMGWGVYNQDLTPLNLLLEVGAHENTRGAAEKSMDYFADVVANYFYGLPVGEEGKVPPRADKPGALGGSVGGTVAAIIILVTAALAGFYFLNNPGAWDRFKEQLVYYFGREGIIWKEGFNNLTQIGQKILSGLRAIVVYVLMLGKIIKELFQKTRIK
ncbi:MAG: stage II sporulation protein P [Firmicutes bacterium]|nr:stage II sporulation protein P [Bacillota bacterium]